MRCHGLWYNHLSQKTQEWSLSHSWTVTNNLERIHVEWNTYHRCGDQDTWSAGTSSHVQHGSQLCSCLTHKNQYIRQSRVHCHLRQGQSQHVWSRTYQSICVKEANPQRVTQPSQRHVDIPTCQANSRPDIWPCDYSDTIKCRPTSLNWVPWSSPQCLQAEDKYNEHFLPPHISEIGNKGNMAEIHQSLKLYLMTEARCRYSVFTHSRNQEDTGRQHLNQNQARSTKDARDGIQNQK